MRVKVFFGKEDSGKSLEVPKGQTIESLLKRMKINPQAVIVMRNGEVVPEQETVEEKDTIRIVRFK
jgi:thiamine biosynthesis protein ThiS